MWSRLTEHVEQARHLILFHYIIYYKWISEKKYILHFCKAFLWMKWPGEIHKSPWEGIWRELRENNTSSWYKDIKCINASCWWAGVTSLSLAIGHLSRTSIVFVILWRTMFLFFQGSINGHDQMIQDSSRKFRIHIFEQFAPWRFNKVPLPHWLDLRSPGVNRQKRVDSFILNIRSRQCANHDDHVFDEIPRDRSRALPLWKWRQ